MARSDDETPDSDDDDDEPVDSLLAAVAAIPAKQLDSIAHAETLGDPDEARSPGATVGRYKIGKKLGAGGMGVVFEAIDPELDRRVAVKVMRKQRRSDGSLAERLRREAQALARLSHPNVVGVHDVGLHHGDLFIVMQLVEGQTLDEWLAAKSRSQREIIDAMVAAGRGLAAAHAAGIVHRDFKPSNLLIGADGIVRVSDFGLARETHRAEPPELGSITLTGSSSLTSGGLVGSPGYMAPEQFEGATITHATDQFAFCVTLWEALVGERPFKGDTLRELADEVVHGRRRPLPRGTAIPRRVRDVLERGLATDAARRFGSMEELLAALEERPRRTRNLIVGTTTLLAMGAVVVGLGLRSTPVDPCVVAAARIRSHYNPLIAASLRLHLAQDPFADEDVVSFERFAARWAIARRDGCREPSRRELRARQVACLDLELHGLDAALARPLWQSESWGVTRPALPSVKRCMTDAPELAPTIRPLGQAGPPWIRGFAMAPDGRIAISHDGMIRILSTSAERALQVPPDVGTGWLEQWDADNQLWFVRDSTAVLVDAERGTSTTRALPPNTYAISPDHRRGLADVKPGEEWALVDLATGTRTVLKGTTGQLSNLAWSVDSRYVAADAWSITGSITDNRLRIIDAQRGTWTDMSMRLDHGLEGAPTLAWIGSDRVVVSGRNDPTHGEDSWIAWIENGAVVEWELALPAPPMSTSMIFDDTAGHAAGVIDSTSTRVMRFKDGSEDTVVKALDITGPSRLILVDHDGRQFLVRSGMGMGFVSEQTGAFTRSPVQAPSALYDRDHLLAIEAGELRVVDFAGHRRTLLKLDDPVQEVRCGPQGGHCIVIKRDTARTFVRVLQGTELGPPIEVGPRMLDVVISPDGRTLAASNITKSVLIIDIATGKREHWDVSMDGCDDDGGTQALAWSTDGKALYVSAVCRAGLSRLYRLAPPAPPTLIYNKEYVGHMAASPDGAIYAVVRRFESQPVIVDGL